MLQVVTASESATMKLPAWLVGEFFGSYRAKNSLSINSDWASGAT